MNAGGVNPPRPNRRALLSSSSYVHCVTLLGLAEYPHLAWGLNVGDHSLTAPVKISRGGQ